MSSSFPFMTNFIYIIILMKGSFCISVALSTKQKNGSVNHCATLNRRLRVSNGALSHNEADVWTIKLRNESVFNPNGLRNDLAFLLVLQAAFGQQQNINNSVVGSGWKQETWPTFTNILLMPVVSQPSVSQILRGPQ